MTRTSHFGKKIASLLINLITFRLDLYHQLGLTEHRSSVVASVGESVKRGVSLQLDFKQARVVTKARAARDEKVS